MENIVKKYDVNAIVNFAAETHVDNSIKNNSKFVQTNINGTMALLESCRSIWGANSTNKFVQVSTDEVFGHLEPNAPAFCEDTCYNPRNPYSATKAAADHLVEAYCNTYKLNGAITHCSNNYGPGQHVEKLIPKTITRALKGETIPVYGDGLQVRDWIYVEDHARGIMNVLHGDTQRGEHFCIGASNEIRNIDLVESICKQLDTIKPLEHGSYAELITFVEDRAGHDRRYAIDSSKMLQRFNWGPQCDFNSGISRTIGYYLNK
jgi:dTDP-glucose 4,6-dehydratase